MAVKFLQVTPEKAYKILQDCIVSGYETRDTIAKINNLFSRDIEEREKEFGKIVTEWTIKTMSQLKKIYPTLLQTYEFHDIGRNFQGTSDLLYSSPNIGQENRDDFRSVMDVLNQRINLLKDWADFLLRQPSMQISTKGDLIMQVGNGHNAEIKK